MSVGADGRATDVPTRFPDGLVHVAYWSAWDGAMKTRCGRHHSLRLSPTKQLLTCLLCIAANRWR